MANTHSINDKANLNILTPTLLRVFPELTKPEVRVLCLYAAAHDMRKMAQELGISINTISIHLAHMKEKYGLEKSSELRNVYASRTNTLYLLALRNFYSH